MIILKTQLAVTVSTLIHVCLLLLNTCGRKAEMAAPLLHMLNHSYPFSEGWVRNLLYLFENGKTSSEANLRMFKVMGRRF
jgi:hypothetical protein